MATVKDLEARIQELEAAVVSVAQAGVTHWQKPQSGPLREVWERAEKHSPPADDGSPERRPFE